MVERHTHARVVIREEREEESGHLVRENLALPPAGGLLVTWRRAAAMGILLAGLLAAGIYFWKTRAAAVPEEAGHSLAVLPFQSLAGAPDDEHLGTGRGGCRDYQAEQLAAIARETYRCGDPLCRP